MLRKPEWIRVKAPVFKGYQETRDLVRSHIGHFGSGHNHLQ